MEPLAIDQVRLNFNPQGLMVINAAIGLMMLGVSLDLKIEDFKRILVSPKAPGIGLFAQFLLLPAFTFLLTLILKPHPSMALGMILVAACPGSGFVAIQQTTLFSIPLLSIESTSEFIVPSRYALTPGASASSTLMARGARESGNACVWKSIMSRFIFVSYFL